MGPGSNFCSKCGRPLSPVVPPIYQPYQAPKAMTLRSLIMGIGTYGTIALLALMAANIIITIWGVGLVYPHMDRHIALFVITPFIVNLAVLGGELFFIYYVLLTLAIIASFIWMLKKSFVPLSDEMAVKYPARGHSPLYVIGTIFMAVLSFNIIYYLLIQGSGTSPTTPSFASQELWQIIYGFAEASVWEEVVSRILLIGLPLLVIDALLRSNNPDRKMRKLHQYLLGGGFSIGRKEAFLLVFSAIMFGMAHVFSWDVFKIFPAAVAGLAFGYLFLKLGVYAAIMLHFAFDFLSVPLDVFPDSTLLTLILGLMIIVWVVLGVPYLMLYASKGVGWLRGKRIWPDVPKAATEPNYGAHYGGYQYTGYQPPTPYVPPAPSYAGNTTRDRGAASRIWKGARPDRLRLHLPQLREPRGIIQGRAAHLYPLRSEELGAILQGPEAVPADQGVLQPPGLDDVAALIAG